MQSSSLGAFGSVSRLTLGGGGIGNYWGKLPDAEAIDTLRHAVTHGIDLIDTAPGYGRCERMVAEAFAGRLPSGVRITSKYSLGTPPKEEVYPRAPRSREVSRPCASSAST